MPSKYLRENETLLGASSALLPVLDRCRSLSSIWDSAKKIDAIGNFERFILALDLLYLLGIVELRDNEIVKTKYDSQNLG